MNNNLLEILKKHSTKDVVKPTHMTFYGPSQTWSLNDCECESFWLNYCKLAKSTENCGKRNERNLCIAEMPKQYMPVIVDFTLKFHDIKDDDEGAYQMDFLIAVIYCYQQTLLDVLQISDDGEELTCCILESEECREGDEWVSRFRLQFPYCRTLVNTQVNLIRKAAIKMLRTENVTKRLSQSPTEDWEKVIDATSATSPCVMYGSSKSPDIKPYRLIDIIGKVEVDDFNDPPIRNIEDVFKFEHHEQVSQRLISTDLFDEDEDMEFWLPFFLSLNYGTKVVKTKMMKEESFNLSNSGSKSWSSSLTKSGDSSVSTEEQTPEIMAEKFLAMLDITRCQQECFWLDVGRALYTTYKGLDRGLELWSEFTERSDEYAADDCIEKYPTFLNNKLTVKTLAWYAREDSPEEYDKWHKDWYSPALEKAISTLDNDVAEAIYRVYWLEFACSTLNKKGFYFFDSNIWKRQENAYGLRIKITKNFTNILERLQTEISYNIQESSDIKYKDVAQMHLKKILNLINRLKTHRFKENVLNEIQEKFYIENFESLLDSNDSIMGCANCVIEAGDTEAINRPGKPEDYVSKTTGLQFKDFKSMNDPKVKEVTTWFNQVFPDKELCKYAGKLFGSCLRGRNSEKIFAVLTGHGDNSKSMLKKAFECVFGAYSITFPTAIFTTKRNGTGPIPEIARARAVRVAFVQEPDSDDAMRNGAIKEFTGGDRFFARMCNDNGGEIEAMFKLFLMCNHVPIIPHSDKAIKNRVRIIPFLSTWVKNAPKSEEERYKSRLFQMDSRFESKIPSMAPAIMWYLIQMYNEYCKEGLRQPQIIIDHTNEYWANNDIYIQFLTENVATAYKDIPNWPEGQEKPIDLEQIIKVGDLYSRFKDWYKEFYPSQKCPERPIMVEEVETRLKQKCRENHWKGIKFRIEAMPIF